MTTVDQIADILLRHLQGTLSDAEQEQLQQWLSVSAQRRHFFAQLDDEDKLREQLLLFIPETEAATEDAIFAKINVIRHQEEEAKVIPLRKRGWIRYAAAAVILVGGVSYFWITGSKDQSSLPKPALAKTEILPGTTGAVLTLADGRQVILDSAGNGLIATESGTAVVLENGKLLYGANDEGTGKASFNTMTTPKGRQFQLILPDGTKVWLNANSSIRYPVEFAGHERKVYIAGEAYFEVAKDMRRPFFVNVNNIADVEVLGTEFNVNAYDNEKLIRTTLINGSVRVAALEAEPRTDARLNELILKPGQEAQVVNITAAQKQRQNRNAVTLSDEVDIEKVTAWKNGFFNFENADIGEVMRQLERWYDIEVVYENSVADIDFVGEIGRNFPLKDVLDFLQRAEVSFRLEEGRRLVVLNK